MAEWNYAYLEKPPSEYCVYTDIEMENMGSTSKLVAILTNAAEKTGPQHPVWAEMFVFQALEQRLALKLPADKFLKIFQKIGRCLKKLILVNLSKLYMDLSQMFIRCSHNPASDIYLPSCQQLEYLLIRCMGVSKLLSQTRSYSMDTFFCLIQRLKIGHVLHCLVMACSVIARISAMCKALLVEICEWYKELRPWCKKLKCGTLHWNCNMELPEDLWLWLKPESFQKYRIFTKEDEELIFLKRLFQQNLKAAKNGKFEQISNTIFSDDEWTSVQMEQEINGIELSEDIGQSVCRSDFENNQNYEQKKKSAKSCI